MIELNSHPSDIFESIDSYKFKRTYELHRHKHIHLQKGTRFAMSRMLQTGDFGVPENTHKSQNRRFWRVPEDYTKNKKRLGHTGAQAMFFIFLNVII